MAAPALDLKLFFKASSRIKKRKANLVAIKIFKSTVKVKNHFSL